MPKAIFQEQVIPLVLTAVLVIVLWFLLWLEITVLNYWQPTQPIALKLLWADVLVGLTIYLKTSIDFAIFIGHLMRTHSGWKNRIAIECGTAIGNALGTFVILAIWNFFREIDWLLAAMVIVASLVLFKLAEDGLAHAYTESSRYPGWFMPTVRDLNNFLQIINNFTQPVLSRLVPHASLNPTKQYSWWGLAIFAGSIPFILGLDDFAGYVPLFSVVHVYGFAVGVLLGHMILNIALFLAPDRTIQVVKQPVISFLGSVAFVGLALWGLFEAVHIILGH